MSKILVLKDKNIKIKVHKTYLEFNNENKDFIVAFKHISQVYCTKHIDISVQQLIEVAKKVPLFFIDHNGYIIAEVKADV